MNVLMNINFEYGYLTNENGFFTFKLSGLPHERIDNVNITIDNQNNLQAFYVDKHWRENYHFNGLSFFNLSEFRFEPKEVLEEYHEKIVETKTKFWFWKQTKEIVRVKKGIVRLNKPLERKAVKASNWYIETKTEILKNTIL